LTAACAECGTRPVPLELGRKNPQLVDFALPDQPLGRMRILVHAHAPSRGADAWAALQVGGEAAGSKLC
jgi:hypothetical protein